MGQGSEVREDREQTESIYSGRGTRGGRQSSGKTGRAKKSGREGQEKGSGSEQTLTCRHKEDSSAEDDVVPGLVELAGGDAKAAHEEQDDAEDGEDAGGSHGA